MIVFLTVLQAVCGAGIFLLDRLSRRSVGVNHHVVFRRHQYLQTVLSAGHVRIYAAVLLLLFLLVLALLIRGVRRGGPRRAAAEAGVLLALTALLEAELLLPLFAALPIYVYLLGLTLVIWVLQALKLPLAARRKTRP
jgi:hypothetical protein